MDADSAETAAAQAGTGTAGDIMSKLHKGIQFRTAVFEEIAGAFMALEEEFDFGEIDDEELANIKSVGDLVKFVQKRVAE